jgi:chemotaxis protein MotA
MDIMIILGLIGAAISFYVGMPSLLTEYGTYLQVNSFVFVLGGTLCSIMISTSLTEFKTIFILFKQLIFKPKRLAPKAVVIKLVKIAEIAQGSNKQNLVKEGVGIGDGFLERALVLVAEGLDAEFIKRTLETDIEEMHARHGAMISMVRSMGSFAPMFGMMGTVMGVTQVLKNVTDIDTIVSGMSLALLTTLYGLILSSILFIPLTNKLRNITARETLSKVIITEGILMILDKEIPLKVEKYLSAYLPGKEKNGKD